MNMEFINYDFNWRRGLSEEPPATIRTVSLVVAVHRLHHTPLYVLMKNLKNSSPEIIYSHHSVGLNREISPRLATLYFYYSISICLPRQFFCGFIAENRRPSFRGSPFVATINYSLSSLPYVVRPFTPSWIAGLVMLLFTRILSVHFQHVKELPSRS